MLEMATLCVGFLACRLHPALAPVELPIRALEQEVVLDEVVDYLMRRDVSPKCMTTGANDPFELPATVCTRNADISLTLPVQVSVGSSEYRCVWHFMLPVLRTYHDDISARYTCPNADALSASGGFSEEKSVALFWYSLERLSESLKMPDTPGSPDEDPE